MRDHSTGNSRLRTLRSSDFIVNKENRREARRNALRGVRKPQFISKLLMKTRPSLLP